MSPLEGEKVSDAPMLYPMARWAAGLTYEQIPESIAHEARLSLLDTIGCIIDGFADPDCQSILAAEREVAAASGTGAATVAVSGDRLSLAAAANVNSCFAGIHELDENVAGHASLVTVPVGLALTEGHRRSGRELITSMVAAYEVIGRMLDSTMDGHKSYNDSGITPNTAANTAGAAAQTAILLGADAKGVFDAINVGLTLFPFGGMVNAKTGSQVKPLMFSGWQVCAGISSALYAKAGITAAGDILETEYGGYLRTVADSWRAEVFGEGLGEAWQLENPYRKLHACCGLAHSSIDGTWDLLRDNDLQVSDIERIDVDLPRHSYELVGSPTLGGLTPRGAQFHLPYVMSVALLKGRPVAPADTSADSLAANVANPQFTALMAAVNPAQDAELAGWYCCRLKVTTKSGQQFEALLDDPMALAKRRLGDVEVEEKFRSLASTQIGDAAIDEIIAMVHNIEQVDDVGTLVRLMVD